MNNNAHHNPTSYLVHIPQMIDLNRNILERLEPKLEHSKCVLEHSSRTVMDGVERCLCWVVGIVKSVSVSRGDCLRQGVSSIGKVVVFQLRPHILNARESCIEPIYRVAK